MVNHCTCNLNFICARYVIRSRSNNDILTISAFFLNNIWLSWLLNMYNVIFDGSAITVIVPVIFDFVNIEVSCYFIIIVFRPSCIIVRVRNIVALSNSRWSMWNKYKELVLLVIYDKLERHSNGLIPLCGANSFSCKSIELDEQNFICWVYIQPSISFFLALTIVAFYHILTSHRAFHEIFSKTTLEVRMWTLQR